MTIQIIARSSSYTLLLVAATTTACFGADDSTGADSVAGSTESSGESTESGAATESGSSTETSGSTTSDTDSTTTTNDTAADSTTSAAETTDTATTESTEGPPEWCGNGMVEDGEECDDGNLDDSDQCTSACQLASCDDGLHNGDESDLDCGGSCMPCTLGAGCGTGADCETQVCTDALCSYPDSCADLHAQAPALPSGVYMVDIDGGGAQAPFEVMCEMEVDGGGWTLLQRTVWDPAETQPLRTNFQTWLNSTIGSLDPGRGYRMAGMHWEHFNGAKDHLLVHYMRRAADLLSCEPLYYKGTGGDINVGETTTYLTGLAAEVDITNSNIELSTTTSGPYPWCLNDNKATPWFYHGCCNTCPTYQGPYWSEPHPMMRYSHIPDLFGQTRADTCGGGDAMPSLYGPNNNYRGVNVMEYYIR